MTLFENQRETNLSSAVALVEGVLTDLGHGLATSRVAGASAGHAWRVTQGSATVDVGLVVRDGAHHLRVAASVLRLPAEERRPALFARLLELNASHLVGAAFALEGDQIVLVGQRSTLDLDRSEVHALLVGVLRDADRFDDELAAAFGGE